MALTTVSVIKTQLGISGTSEDTKLTQLLTQADALIKKYIGQNVEQATYTEFYCGNGTQLLVLNQRPVQSITTIHLDGDGYFGDGSGAFAAADLLTAGEDYVLNRDNNTATEKSLSGIVYRIGTVWDRPSARVAGLLSTVPGIAIGNIKVVYVAGYATVPSDLALACIQMVAMLRENSTIGNMKSESYEDYSYTLADQSMQNELIGSVQSLLKPYKRFVI